MNQQELELENVYLTNKLKNLSAFASRILNRELTQT